MMSPEHRPLWRTLQTVIAIVLATYPLAVWAIHSRFTPAQLLAGWLVIFAARMLVVTWIDPRHVLRRLTLGAASLVAGLILLASGNTLPVLWLRFYPAVLDLIVAALFIGSLFTARPLVERIARLMQPDLPPAGVRYTRQVTRLWGGVMVAIAIVSIFTALATPLSTWSLFNGLIVHILMGIVFVCEYGVRVRVRRRWERS